MNKKTLKIITLVLSIFLAAELIFVGVMHFRQPDPVLETVPTTVPTEAPETTIQMPETTEAPTEETEAPTEETTVPTEPEPQEQRYILTFTGDCTLGSDPGDFASPHSFIGTIGEDYDFPFRNVVHLFEKDDFTIINLESVLADTNAGETSKRFTFRGPTAYTQILTGSSVEAVTLANNHTADFGKEGYDSTIAALKEAGVEYVEENKTKLVTTDSGLIIGLYADSFTFSKADIQKNVASLRSQGAEIIICAFHWGNEGSYRPTGDQQAFAKAAIDAGADIVYGHHPHVLQRVETYGKGVIFYSLGNFSFGGNNFPRDLDSAIMQQEVIRDVDGTVRLGELKMIPVSITSMAVQNNFQPTPYEEGTDKYDRTMSKLDGSFNGPDLLVDYSFMDKTEPTDPSEPAGTEAPGTDTPTDTPNAPEGDSEVPPPGDVSTGDTGTGDSGDAGNTGDTGSTDSGDSGADVPPPADPGSGET